MLHVFCARERRAALLPLHGVPLCHVWKQICHTPTFGNKSCKVILQCVICCSKSKVTNQTSSIELNKLFLFLGASSSLRAFILTFASDMDDHPTEAQESSVLRKQSKSTQKYLFLNGKFKLPNFPDYKSRFFS